MAVIDTPNQQKPTRRSKSFIAAMALSRHWPAAVPAGQILLVAGEAMGFQSPTTPAWCAAHPCFDNAFDPGAPPPTPKPGSAAPGEYAIFLLERACA
jgi:hypothetical protein